MNLFLVYLCIINAISLLLMLIDKHKARKNHWRIPEHTLLGISVIGGSLGGLIGMYLFRHKTQHLRFSIGIPMMLIIQVAVLYYFRELLF